MSKNKILSDFIKDLDSAATDSFLFTSSGGDRTVARPLRTTDITNVDAPYDSASTLALIDSAYVKTTLGSGSFADSDANQVVTALSGPIVPTTSMTLGTTSKRWKNIYTNKLSFGGISIDTNGLDGGNATLSAFTTPSDYSYNEVTLSNTPTAGSLVITTETDLGSISASDQYAGSKSYYVDSLTNATYTHRIEYGIGQTEFNTFDKIEIEFYAKILQHDNFGSMFQISGYDTGGSNEATAYIRANRNGISAAGIGITNNGFNTITDTTGWCTWTSWNKFNIELDLANTTGYIKVNDTTTMSASIPTEWLGWTNSKIIFAIGQLRTGNLANDNGVEAYFDNVSVKAYTGSTLVETATQDFESGSTTLTSYLV